MDQLPLSASPNGKQRLADMECAIENPILSLSRASSDDEEEDQKPVGPVVHHGIFCDGPSCTKTPHQDPIEGIRYKCAKCANIDFCSRCVLDEANPHDRSHPLFKCETATALSNARRALKNSTTTRPTSETRVGRGYDLHSFRFEGFNNHVTQTIVKSVIQRKDEDIQDPEVRQMVQDLREALSKLGKETSNALDAHRTASKYDVDPLSEEDMERVSVSFVLDDSRRPDQGQSAQTTAEQEEKWSEYKHHHFVRRWGLLTEARGRDEEWWIETPKVLDENDPGFLCDMCRHIDFKALLTQRNLPGNTAPGPTQIALHALGRIMTDSPCAFCRLLRRSYREIGFPIDSLPEVLEGQEFVLTVLDEGPQNSLRLEISVQLGVTHGDYDWLPPIVIQWVDSADDRPLRGRSIRKDKADLMLLKSWIGVCETHESPADDGPRESPQADQSLQLRLIDVHENRIVVPKGTPRYACLSYVWGGVTQVQYTSATRSILETKNGLCHPSVTLPQTIKDAMEVARQIGLDYIWVDSLCILQDSKADVIEKVARAGRIYNGAALTIVASTNLNPNHGLPGVSTVPRSKQQTRETIQGMCLGKVFHDPRRRLDDIEDSTWNSRAWTYQERQLSPRTVYFTDSEMIFMCRHATFFEDTAPVMDLNWRPQPAKEFFNSNPRNIEWHVWIDPTQRQFPNKGFETSDGIVIMVAEDPTRKGEPCADPAPTYRITRLAGPHLPGRLHDNAEGLTPWDKYARAVRQYTKRCLTFHEDAVRAFSGMEYLIAQGLNTKFWYGVPEFFFDRALLWYPNEPLERRKQGDWALFPSWSWAAWKGRIFYRGKGWHNSQYHGPASVIDWYQNMPREEFLARYPVDSNSGRPMAELIDELKLHRLLSAFDSDELKKIVNPEDGWIPQLDEVSNQHYYTHEAYPDTRFDYPINLPGQEIMERPDREGTLYFKAYIARTQLWNMSTTTFTAEPPKDDFIQIGTHDENKSSNYRPAWKRILYHQGYRCGFLVLNIPFDEMNSDTQGQYHLAAISRDSLPEIPTPGRKGVLYSALDPRQAQYFIYKESREGEHPLASYVPPDPTASPDAHSVGENGDPHWDEGRFSNRMAFPVYNVLLLRKEGDSWERVGVGKMHFHAFHLARPRVDVVCLK